MVMSDWSSDVCSSDLFRPDAPHDLRWPRLKAAEGDVLVWLLAPAGLLVEEAADRDRDGVDEHCPHGDDEYDCHDADDGVFFAEDEGHLDE